MAANYEHMFAVTSRTFVHDAHQCSRWARYASHMKRKPAAAIETINAAMSAIAEARGWTIEEWCIKAGVTYRTVQHWRASGEATRNLSVSMLEKLAEAAKVPYPLMNMPNLTAADVVNRTSETAILGLANCSKETQDYIIQVITRDLASAKQA